MGGDHRGAEHLLHDTTHYAGKMQALPLNATEPIAMRRSRVIAVRANDSCSAMIVSMQTNRPVSSSPAPERSYHHGDLRETLMEAALASIAAHGTEKLSLRALAREAGVSPTAPYRHFPSKESLLAALAEGGFRELLARFETVVAKAEGDLESRLLAIGMAYIQFALEHPTRYELMFGSVLADFSGYESLQAAGGECYRILYEVLEAGLTSADGSDLTATRLGGVVWAAVHGVASLMLYHRDLRGADDPRAPAASLRAMQLDPERALRTLFAGMR